MNARQPPIDSSLQPTSSGLLALNKEWQPQQQYHYQQQNLASVSRERGSQEAMWQAPFQPQEGAVHPYPERPGEPDCPYYMRTGLCGFGVNCKFNHPPHSKLVSSSHASGQFPERPGQPECQYYLKTGTCKFGPSCKYHHPQGKAGTAGGAQLNILNLPLRLGEKDCAFYLRTGNCKFGATCKFNHPPPLMSVPGSPVFPGAPSGAVHVPQLYPAGAQGLPSPRLPFLPSPRFAAPSNLAPILVPPAQASFPPWNPYQVPISLQEGQQASTGSYMYPAVASAQGHMATGLISPYTPSSGRMMPTTAPSTPLMHGHREEAYPERPGQPECSFYMRTGGCKFGSQCKFHHPRDRNSSIPAGYVTPIGLPLRPGAPPCTFFGRFGFCKFGSACKFDHSLMQTAYTHGSSGAVETVAAHPLAPILSSLPNVSSGQLSKNTSKEEDATSLSASIQKLNIHHEHHSSTL